MATIRRPGAASAAILISLSASMIGAHFLAPEWSRRVGLDVWNFAADEDAQRSATEERDEVDAKAEREARRRARADQLAARLITRDADLGTVSGELLDLFRTDGSRTTLASCHPNVRDPRLLYALHAISRVERLLDNDPPRCEAVRARLETEYRELASAGPSVP